MSDCGIILYTVCQRRKRRKLLKAIEPKRMQSLIHLILNVYSWFYPSCSKYVNSIQSISNSYMQNGLMQNCCLLGIYYTCSGFLFGPFCLYLRSGTASAVVPFWVSFV
uniref:Uncharacterized protein n=1 Tax=Salvator merianae TaxID=96440 RepID=A0A8D0DID7_SALMN